MLSKDTTKMQQCFREMQANQSEALPVRFYWQLNTLYLQFQNFASKNAVSIETANQLHQVLGGKKIAEEFLLNTNTQQIIWCSSVSGIFLSGGNLKEILNSNREQSLELCSKMRLVCETLQKISVRSVCLLEGLAAGGGAELALACDEIWLIGSEARMGLWQARFGVPPGWGGFEKLSEKIGKRQAALFFAASETLYKKQLLQWRIATEEFDTKQEAIEKLAQFELRFTECLPELKQKLLEFNEPQEIFESFWMTPFHKEKLTEFIKKEKK